MSFAFDLKVLVPDYAVDGILFLKRHFEGGYIDRDLILVEAIPDATARGGWRIKYGFQDINPGKPGVDADVRPIGGVGGGDAKADASAASVAASGQQVVSGIAFDIPIAQTTRPGLTGTLRIEARPWS